MHHGLHVVSIYQYPIKAIWSLRGVEINFKLYLAMKIFFYSQFHYVYVTVLKYEAEQYALRNNLQWFKE